MLFLFNENNGFSVFMLSREIIICILAIAASVLTVFVVIQLYQSRKIALYEELQKLKDDWVIEENQRREKLRSDENAAVFKINHERTLLENERQNFEKQVEVFINEQNVRNELSNKTDREVVVEMHVKVMHIYEILEEMSQLIESNTNDINSLESVTNDLSDTLSNLEESVEYTLSEFKSEIDEKLDSVEYQIVQTIGNNSQGSSIDIDDIRSAISDAISNDSYTLPDNLNSLIEDAVSSAIDSKLNDIESKLSDIEWKIDLNSNE